MAYRHMAYRRSPDRPKMAERPGYGNRTFRTADAIEHVAGADAELQALQRGFFHHDAADRRAQGERARGTAGALQARELIGRDISILEARKRRGRNRLRIVT